MRIRSKNVLKGQNFHNRRRAIALPAAKTTTIDCLKGRTLSQKNSSFAFQAMMRTIVLPHTALRLYAVMKIKPIRAKITFATLDSHYLYIFITVKLNLFFDYEKTALFQAGCNNLICTRFAMYGLQLQPAPYPAGKINKPLRKCILQEMPL
ncbi:MAG: hypothetical protein LBG92_09925 [Prevotellaceae bacterium]|jgi:hypothetical protein|nr:hypothetical protein [Prevotellaceae bacterium]